ncbi:hypothetical protein ACI797_06500 [Geodermatophilus sp. SYSU D00691]
MALEWAGLTAGGVLLFLCVFPTTSVYRGRPVPRLGFVPQRPTGPARWWSLAALAAGVFLVSFCAGRLAATDAGFLGLFAGTVLLAWVGQAAVVAWHNRRVAGAAGTRPPAEIT